MPWNDIVEAHVQALREPEAPQGMFNCAVGLFNPWEGDDPDGVNGAAQVRRNQLAQYLQARENASYVLVGEASGWHGCRFTGIPFTSERMVLGHHDRVQQGHVFRNVGVAQRTSALCEWQNSIQCTSGMTERSATIVWNALLCLGVCSFDFVLWNVVPWHPHEPNLPMTNRSGGTSLICLELQRGGIHLRDTLENLFPNAIVVAMGETAKIAVSLLRSDVKCVKHPRRAAEFRQEIATIIRA